VHQQLEEMARGWLLLLRMRRQSEQFFHLEDRLVGSETNDRLILWPRLRLPEAQLSS